MRPNVNRRAGDYAFHSNHVVNGATGSHGTDPIAVAVVHATGSHSDPDPVTGVMTPDPRAQNGWDAVVTKISGAGVFEGIYAVDTMPVDGKYDDTSLNSGWGGYSYFTDLDSFAASGDNDNMVAMGSFRGKLTFPTAAGATPVTLENPKWQKYDGFLTKFNVNTNKVVWASGDKIQRPTCNTKTDGSPDKECDEPTSVGGSVSTTSEGHVIATSNYGNSGRSTTNGRLFLVNGNTGANVWEKDFGEKNFMFGTETIGTHQGLRCWHHQWRRNRPIQYRHDEQLHRGTRHRRRRCLGCWLGCIPVVRNVWREGDCRFHRGRPRWHPLVRRWSP